jgi:hypothetical protein
MPKLIVDATGDEFFREFEDGLKCWPKMESPTSFPMLIDPLPASRFPFPIFPHPLIAEPQDDDFWWGQLPGENLRMMVDNAEHSMATGALYLITGAEVWYKALLDGTPRPVFDWTRSNVTNSISVNVYGTNQPVKVVNRMTTTLDGYRRDFRLVAGDTPANPCKYIAIPLFGSACLRPIIWIGNSIGVTMPYNATLGYSTYVAHQDIPDVGWRGFLVELYFNSTIPGLYFQLTTQIMMVPAPNTPLYPFPLCVGAQCVGDLV